MSKTHFRLLAAIFVMAIFAQGCSLVSEIPNPEEVIKYPLGKTDLRVGMSKEEVEMKWGKPDEVRMVDDKAKWPSPREMWVYRAQTGIPIDAGYLSKTKRLYFDGNNLTDMSD